MLESGPRGETCAVMKELLRAYYRTRCRRTDIAKQLKSMRIAYIDIGELDEARRDDRAAWRCLLGQPLLNSLLAELFV